ncbi:hypothetical protein [Pseudogulbenkiania subflava]|uniref:Uncharacterized protein n=1 Tax=Pseudogulbenkiania subflava DSM 22618 TaxID=1123014 RepID=A0A1Y6BBK4_9NEIS|nr:hypothetical protein [Pseudogulbenkiania subflava]SME92353.1 hypothetical protein SAMN02745746_00069 [Pseudogulbenkiania subflava DSM 22618]
MKRLAYQGCAVISIAVAGGAIGVYGVSPATLAMALVLVLCPVLVVWLTVCPARRTTLARGAAPR